MTNEDTIKEAKIKEEEIKKRKLKIKIKKTSIKEKKKIKEKVKENKNNIQTSYKNENENKKEDENEENEENEEHNEINEEILSGEENSEDEDALQNISSVFENENMSKLAISEKLFTEELQKEEELLLDHHNIIEIKDFKRNIKNINPQDLNVDFNEKIKRKRTPSLKIIEWNASKNKIKKILKD